LHGLAAVLSTKPSLEVIQNDGGVTVAPSLLAVGCSRTLFAMTSKLSASLPPDDLMTRIGVSPDAFPTRESREKIFEDVGYAVYECIRNEVPRKDEQAILDFGCGSGRVLRWFAEEPGLRLAGCDIDASSIAWMQAKFDPAIRLYVSSSTPPLPEQDDTFDLVYCGSVFSHLTGWAPWLLELRRILKPGGVLVASLHGRGFWHLGFHGARGIPWDEDKTGLLVEHYGSRFEDSWGPAIYASEWWVREHWGRAFDIERFEAIGFGLPPENQTIGQAWVVARKPETTSAALTPFDLESPSMDAREATAALWAQQLAYEEVEHLAGHLRSLLLAQQAELEPNKTPQAVTLPFPPLELANRVGSLDDAADPIAFYNELGCHAYDEIVHRLPENWTFAGKRVLDFGCGAGRTLRHFVAEASLGEVWGCDIDEPSIQWLNEHLCPPFHAVLNEADPPLEFPSSSFDLIWGISVFTHLVDNWSQWLAELHRILKADGLVYLTFMGQGTSDLIAGEPWNEERVGMNVLKYGQRWDLGGPMVMHSPWWIEEHWGRAFEILSLRPDGFGSDPIFGHGSVLMRKRNQSVNVEVLERIEPGNPREAVALAHNVKQLRAEVAALRNDVAYLRSQGEHTPTLEIQVADLTRRLTVLEGSKSWTLTKPLRLVARQIRTALR
jgi:SAM-dependent methyltransferase